MSKQREMKKAIELTWQNPEGKELRDMLFPNGKPSTEEFIRVVAEYVLTNNSASEPTVSKTM